MLADIRERDRCDRGHNGRLCRWCFRLALRQGLTPEQSAKLNRMAERASRKSDRYKPPPKRYKPTAVHPRTEDAAKVYARLHASISKAAEDKPRATRVIGRACGSGYVVAATDDHRALIQPGTAADSTMDLSLVGEEWIDLPPEFHLVLKRIMLCANPYQPAIRITVAEGRLTIDTRDTREGLAASEWLPLPETADRPPFVCAVDASYLEPLCGVWPLRWYLRRGETAYQSFQPIGAAWRYILMPLRINWT